MPLTPYMYFLCHSSHAVIYHLAIEIKRRLKAMKLGIEHRNEQFVLLPRHALYSHLIRPLQDSIYCHTEK